ncbi:hypothetical protein [Xanthomonas sp. SHU 308]|uniref:hypothetical protein n=1 Tax=Xanthomonas sp. SHU 308 TaxID=1591201 RepID=UPI0012FEF1DF|nr:hypothetical protein [Xanthomonas sp. SHU 308]
MTAGYRSGGVDFDDLFDPYVQGDFARDCGMRSGGIDLSRRYAPIAFGGKRADVGYRSGGVDVSNLWAAKGTARYSLGFDGRSYQRGITALSGQTGTITASISLSLGSDGRWVVDGTGTGSTESGSWLPPGSNAGDFEVQFGFVLSEGVVPSDVSNGADAFASLGTSRGIRFTNSTNAATGPRRESKLSVTCRLRRISTGAITTSTCALTVFVEPQR